MAALGVPWAILRALPTATAVRVGAALGASAGMLDRHNRSIGLRNLAIAFPDQAPAERARTLSGAYRTFGRMAAEWVHFFDLDRSNIERYVSYRGIEHWEEAVRISRGRGILILTGHFGNFELLSGAHSIYGNRCAIVQRPNRNPLIDAAVTARRERFGNRAIPRRGAARTVMRLLRDDWMVAIPLDLDTRRGVFVDFFGKPAATSDALARVAMASGAPVLPAFLFRRGESAHNEITFLPVIDLARDPDRSRAVLENTQRFTAVIESVVRERPDHWNWIHRRWKTRPPAEIRFY